jgi:hypothetical protein
MAASARLVYVLKILSVAKHATMTGLYALNALIQMIKSKELNV